MQPDKMTATHVMADVEVIGSTRQERPGYQVDVGCDGLRVSMLTVALASL